MKDPTAALRSSIPCGAATSVIFALPHLCTNLGVLGGRAYERCWFYFLAFILRLFFWFFWEGGRWPINMKLVAHIKTPG